MLRRLPTARLDPRDERPPPPASLPAERSARPLRARVGSGPVRHRTPVATPRRVRRPAISQPKSQPLPAGHPRLVPIGIGRERPPATLSSGASGVRNRRIPETRDIPATAGGDVDTAVPGDCDAIEGLDELTQPPPQRRLVGAAARWAGVKQASGIASTIRRRRDSTMSRFRRIPPSAVIRSSPPSTASGKRTRMSGATRVLTSRRGHRRRSPLPPRTPAGQRLRLRAG